MHHYNILFNNVIPYTIKFITFFIDVKNNKKYIVTCVKGMFNDISFYLETKINNLIENCSQQLNSVTSAKKSENLTMQMIQAQRHKLQTRQIDRRVDKQPDNKSSSSRLTNQKTTLIKLKELITEHNLQCITRIVEEIEFISEREFDFTFVPLTDDIDYYLRYKFLITIDGKFHKSFILLDHNQIAPPRQDPVQDTQDKEVLSDYNNLHASGNSNTPSTLSTPFDIPDDFE